ncbi:MAG TPA: tetratricopeptide repeat protein [Pyrinomonadaceae bacterium]|nr:tetratricopeptide repeat protein [Pyrinomonadaceae bacterium]
MKIKIFIAVSIFAVLSAPSIFAQISKETFSQADVSKISERSGENQAQQQSSEVLRERRSLAYAKLLEGQRYIWLITSRRISSEATTASYSKLAKQALQKAVELDPTLAEGYTALAYLAKNPYDIEESILLAGIAVKIDRNNFGAHQILAQLYTVKSLLNTDALDLNFAQKAISEWNEIARLDPRNAEAFAFLSEFYRKTNKKAEQIAALRNWLSASTPISDGFYGIVYRGKSLLPQAGTVKLGQALLEDKQTRESIEILSRAVAEEPENTEAIGLLRSAIEAADNDSVKTAVQALQQAAYANPDNPFLPLLLAQVQSRTGKIDDAIKILRDASAKYAEKDKIASADLQVALADIYSESNRVDEAAAIYQNALTTRGIVVKNNILMDDERNFAVHVFEKIINLYRKANRPNDAKAAIERAKLLLGK